MVGSLLLGLYDKDGRLHHVGFTSAIKATDKKKLTATLNNRDLPETSRRPEPLVERTIR